MALRGVVTRGYALLTLLRASSSVASSESSCSATSGPLPYTLLKKVQQSADSWWLRFALPPPRRWLADDTTLPTCIKVEYPDGTDDNGQPKRLAKSYSPVSHPAAEGIVELVVKAYPLRPGGGVGAYLCSLEPGQTMHAEIKGKRMMHGSAAVAQRWQSVGLVAGGTGIAPLLQIARILLEDPDDHSAVYLLSINRREQDILMRQEIERLAIKHTERFTVTYSLTGPPPAGWTGQTGRGSMDMVSAALPRPTGDGKTMVLVCGTDGFVATWGGPVGRAPKGADGFKGAKVQGPLLGFLSEAGFGAAEVFKY